jgi:hypothetical protein
MVLFNEQLTYRRQMPSCRTSSWFGEGLSTAISWVNAILSMCGVYSLTFTDTQSLSQIDGSDKTCISESAFFHSLPAE